MKFSNFIFEFLSHLRVPSNVASAAGACPVRLDRGNGSVLHAGVPRGPQVVVSAPHRHTTVVVALEGLRVHTVGRQAGHLPEYTIRVILLLGIDLLAEELIILITRVIHDVLSHLLRGLGDDGVRLNEGAFRFVDAERAEAPRKYGAEVPILLEQHTAVIPHESLIHRSQERARHFM